MENIFGDPVAFFSDTILIHKTTINIVPLKKSTWLSKFFVLLW